MLKSLKRACLAVGRSCGVFELAARSGWRNSRLLVLGYHGISLEDEHQWNPALYLNPETFRTRMEALKRNRCSVLGLEDAIQRLSRRELPKRSVVLTFDDGNYDFYKTAWPILKEYGYPGTLYLTTYYASLQCPVPRIIWGYMLWKKRGCVVDAGQVLGDPVSFDLTTEAGRTAAFRRIVLFADSRNMNGEQRNGLSAELADLLGLNYDTLCSKRIAQLVRPEEMQEISRDGVSVQLHTHHHRTPDDRGSFLQELNDNRDYIRKIVGSEPRHFCYPSGRYKPEFVPWLREFGIISATTCDPRLVSTLDDPLLIPRLVDTSFLSAIEFESWLSGIGALLPRRARSGPPTGY